MKQGNLLINKLLKDHEKLRQLAVEVLEGDKVGPASSVAELLKLLKWHQDLEEELLYPLIQGSKLKGKVFEGYEEHHVLEMLSSEIIQLESNDEIYKAKITVLKENLEHHLAEEEEFIFPALTTLLTQEQLTSLEKYYLLSLEQQSS